ncbi:MAG: ABC transporter ATP-binding protein [Opitutales bacterium]|jgi:ABC-2 type transport system ATP-binding protein|nr:ABC transporter ATP-binding protein [Opitutales bacterium]
MDPVISIDGLSKQYSEGWGRKGRLALNHLSLEVKSGTLLGVIGGNGSGKTTLLKILCVLLPEYDGGVELLGKSPREVAQQNQVAYIPERLRFPAHHTPQSFLNFCGRLSGLSGEHLDDRVEDCLALSSLTGQATRRIGQLSKGGVQRLAVSQALIHEPQVIVADEPMDGLDPLARQKTEQLLRELVEAGKTVLLATHLLEGADSLFDQILVLHRGQSIFEGPPKFDSSLKQWFLETLRKEQEDA